MNKLKRILYDYIEDFFIFIGLFLIVITTFLINFYLGMYMLAIIFIGLGVYFAKNPLRRR
ncbi:hypothetical protein OR62_13910 [Clostridium tetani]|uniref:hypothetical protein n=1 Tax=Clostridium tetani TaxID=1513 RepID=UPI000574CFAD|nr:hypothetical protein [Clostridium tetani]KHO32064.1 hypothetical protein OR62_13910 [Clostridium tetani]RXI57250.1 hypothetical protein DP122_00265 [Clostridium tetani]RXI69609.1 hypothetical protein DQN76_07905 [Clostridium tetani]RXM75116.1 hypothetical protein DP154_10100 [Clostridium tetani]RYU98506.1 hypothetical protein DP144_10825 [Clostridium tetani]